MVNTTELKKPNWKNRIEQSEGDRFPDDDDNVSVVDHYRESNFGENDGEPMRSLERDHKGLRIE